METRKLYYEDSSLTEFTAQVVSCRRDGETFVVRLDRTAFYPTGGGQACDLGRLEDAAVTDVWEEGEAVFHRCEKPLETGSTVRGTIDWARRLDLMQQHTGEHILSGLIFEEYGYHNTGFHVGAQVMEVDFDGPIPAEKIAELERKANEAVWADLELHCFYPSPEELPHVKYRTKRALPWPVRIVRIPGVDSCACCGVHVKRTGQVGLVKILSCTKFHQGIRLEMVCGGRAYEYMRKIFEENRQVAQLLSAKMPETFEAVKKLSEAHSAEKGRVVGLQRRVFEAIAARYAGKGRVLHFEEGLTGGEIRELADRIAQVSGTAVVCSGTDETGYGICLIGPDARTLGTAAMTALNGRGGGKPDAFQGSVKAARDQIGEFFKTVC